jgi:hypothetical protein
MATTTTNNGWDIPQSTDFVKLGADAIATLGQDIDTSAGKTWLAWTTFTPSMSGFNVGSTGTVNAAYVLVGKTLFLRAAFTLGGTGISIGSGPFMTLPNAYVAKGPSVSPIFIEDIGTSFYTGLAFSNGTTVALVLNNVAGTYGTTTGITATTPMTWAANDKLFMNFAIEVA